MTRQRATLGCLAVGLVALGLLVWAWWSLPPREPLSWPLLTPTPLGRWLHD